MRNKSLFYAKYTLFMRKNSLFGSNFVIVDNSDTLSTKQAQKKFGSYVKSHIKKTNPDALILIDYPAFNLKVAKYAKKIGIPVYWFIAPQLWAWKESRISIMRKYIDKLFVALPFELDFFNKRGVNTFYFGHPLVDIISNQNKLPLIYKS